MAPLQRQDGVEGPYGFLRQFGQLASARNQRVGGQHPGPASISQDAQTFAARPRLLRQNVRHKEDVGYAVNAKHAAAAESSIQDFVAAGQRSGMRGRGLGGGGSAPGLDHDHGFV